MAKLPMMKSPENHPTALAYDAECQSALAEHVDKLLDHAEAAGWDRTKAASAMMYLSAKRLKAKTDGA
ncbi:putative Ntn-hydrolase superfamily protein [Aminobacter lissarensis]|uniref:Ntn-hydrolase superfamily protein n=1 Tax=Aminobacter carboxidus TaxID=376165 RepID=A0A8E1WI88_9HYPH|nr:hypothetical protein [Aminobacter lissarensis]MBB6469501.1 putative Ntn-hydrolase superfamily protein [Aminobacter lissarensis]